MAALAATCMFGPLFETGGQQKIDSQCKPTHPDFKQGPYMLRYTALPPLDGFLCGLVTVFHAAFDNKAMSGYYVEGGLMFILPVMMLFVEAGRMKRPLPLAFPALWGMAMQSFSLAVTMPLWSAVFLLMGGANMRGGSQTAIDSKHAIGIAVSAVLGYFVPSTAMLLLNDPYATAVWQFFPIIMSLIQGLTRTIVPNSKNTGLGRSILRYTYLFLFNASFIVHALVIWPAALGHSAQFLKAITPDATLGLSASLPQIVEAFLVRDFLFGTSSTIMCTFWFADNVMEVVWLVFWYLVAIPVFGPGSSIAGVLLWREGRLD